MIEDTRFHYKQDLSKEEAEALIENWYKSGPMFCCPYDRKTCNTSCLCSIWPEIGTYNNAYLGEPTQTRYYALGFRCNNVSFAKGEG